MQASLTRLSAMPIRDALAFDAPDVSVIVTIRISMYGHCPDQFRSIGWSSGCWPNANSRHQQPRLPRLCKWGRATVTKQPL